MKKILVLDSDARIADGLEQALWLKYHVITKTNLVNLVEVYRQLMPDIILIADNIGLYLPKGLTSLLKLKCDGDLAPLILLSGSVNSDMIATETDVAGYLYKPIDMDKLCHLIEEVLMGNLTEIYL